MNVAELVNILQALPDQQATVIIGDGEVSNPANLFGFGL
jgi:hypothetical protein